MSRRLPQREFSLQLLHAAKLQLKLIQDEADHPDRVMIGVAYFLFDALQDGGLARQFHFQEGPAAVNLLANCSWASLPGKRHPGEERRTVALRSPLLALESFGQRRPPAGRRGKHGSLGTRGRIVRFRGADEAAANQFLKRVIDLWAGDSRPVAHFAAFQFEIGLVAVHRALGEQAQQNQVRRGERVPRGVTSAHLSLSRWPSAAGSNTTIVIARQEAADAAPGPQRLRKRRGSRCRGAGR